MSEKFEDSEEKFAEAHAYTPGLKVKRSMIVDKTRRLPLFGEVFVKETLQRGDFGRHLTIPHHIVNHHHEIGGRAA